MSAMKNTMGRIKSKPGMARFDFKIPLSAVGALIEEQNPELAAIFKEAGEFGDRIALRLKELEEKGAVP